MVTPADPAQLQKLETSAHDCERNGDYLGALDAYEEIERQGWANARHLVALGYCYLKNRQRQYARTVWLRALDLEPGSKLCREALDKHFPGWEAKAAPAPRPAAAREAAPPPPPLPRFDQELKVETTSRVVSAAAGELEVSIPGDDPFYKAPPLAARPAAPQAAVPRMPGPAAPPRPERRDEGELRVNWDFVMQDAAEEAVASQR